MATPVRAVVFDLADVLFEFGGAESLARLSRGRVDITEFARFWQSAPADALYRGQCTPEEFADAAVVALRLPATGPEFLSEFRRWLRGPFPGALDLVAEVRQHATVACLSNTNVLDVERFRREFLLPSRFDHCFFSCELGLVKPEPECFSYVLERLGCGAAPASVAFFDDSVEAVAEARRCGLFATQVRSFSELRGHLAAVGVLSSPMAARGA